MRAERARGQGRSLVRSAPVHLHLPIHLHLPVHVRALLLRLLLALLLLLLLARLRWARCSLRPSAPLPLVWGCARSGGLRAPRDKQCGGPARVCSAALLSCTRGRAQRRRQRRKPLTCASMSCSSWATLACPSTSTASARPAKRSEGRELRQSSDNVTCAEHASRCAAPRAHLAPLSGGRSAPAARPGTCTCSAAHGRSARLATRVAPARPQTRASTRYVSAPVSQDVRGGTDERGRLLLGGTLTQADPLAGPLRLPDGDVRVPLAPGAAEAHALVLARTALRVPARHPGDEAREPPLGATPHAAD